MTKIEPITFPIKGVATNFELRVMPFSMDATTATFHYLLLPDLGSEPLSFKKIISEGDIIMSEEEFANWGADNNYCLEWAANKLGLTLIKN
jgi:hypothetical protein